MADWLLQATVITPSFNQILQIIFLSQILLFLPNPSPPPESLLLLNLSPPESFVIHPRNFSCRTTIETPDSFNQSDASSEFGYSNVADQFGCPSPYYNQCYCNLDQASSVTSFVSSCVPTSCSNDGGDVTTAVSLYLDYCSSVGYPFQGTNIAVQTSTEIDGGPNVVTATRPSVVTATATSKTDQPSSAGTLTSFPAVVGLLAALLWPAIVIFQG